MTKDEAPVQEPDLIARLKHPEQHYEFTDPKKANAVLMSLCQEAADALAAPVQEPVAIDGNTSDGYHTFNELYEFRKAYNAALFNEWAAGGKCSVHKSWRHHDNELCFGGGWFIVVAVLPQGQISNHYEAKDWDLFAVPEVERVLFEFDGHTGADVVERLKTYTTPSAAQPASVQPVAHCEAGPEFCQQCHLEDRSLALAAAVRYVQNNTPKLVAAEICMALTTPPAAQPAPVPLTDEQIDAEFEVFASKFNHESNEWLDMGVDEYFRAGFRAAAPAQPAVQEPAGEVIAVPMGLSGDDVQIRTHFYQEIPPVGTKVWATPPAAQPAVPDAFGTREGEHPQYIQGWNDCRAEMLKGMK